MRHQPVPAVSESDLDRVLRREFAGPAAAEAEAILSVYGIQPWHREPVRVKLALLKLAGGDLATLRELTEAASRDYRDILVSAEYRAYARLGREASPQERDAAVEEDWSEYRRWISGDPGVGSGPDGS